MERASNSGLIQCFPARLIQPKDGKPEFRIGGFHKVAGDASAASRIFRGAVDQIAQDSTPIIKSDKHDNVRFLALPFSLSGPSHD